MNGTSETPQHIGNYRIVGRAGRGGMGVVLRGEHVSLGRPAAIKVLPRVLAEQPEFVERFLREARAAAQLDHPNLVRVYDAGRTDDSYYIAMELVPGRSLAEELDRRGPLPVARALEVTRDVASALAEAARHHIIHRDVKPANILVREDGLVKLADLGLAKAIGSPEVTVSQSTLGTPHYMAPEQARDPRSVDTRADIYSLGCTLYHMLTGEVPFTGTSYFTVMKAHEAEPIPDPRQARPDLPEPVAQLIRWMMAKRPQDRPRSPEELLTHIDRLLGRLRRPPTAAAASAPAAPAASAARAPRLLSPLRDPLLLVPILLLGGMLVVGGLLWFQGRRKVSARTRPAPGAEAPAPGEPSGGSAVPEVGTPAELDPLLREALPGAGGKSPSLERLEQAIARLEERVRLGVGDPEQERRLRAALNLLKFSRALRSPDESIRRAALEGAREEFRQRLAQGEYLEMVVMFHYLSRLAQDPQVKPVLKPFLETMAKRLFPPALSKPVTGDWRGTPLREVLEDLSRQVGIAIDFSPEVPLARRNYAVTLTAKEEPLRSVLFRVCRQAGLSYRPEGGRLLIVRPRKALRPARTGRGPGARPRRPRPPGPSRSTGP